MQSFTMHRTAPGHMLCTGTHTAASRNGHRPSLVGSARPSAFRRVLQQHRATPDGTQQLLSPETENPASTLNNGNAIDGQPASSFSSSAANQSQGGLEMDTVLVKELQENGFRSSRRTKLVVTIGPNSCSPEVLEEMAEAGMNLARLNMCHGTHQWHSDVIERIQKLNQEKGYAISVMVDTEGSEIHTRELHEPLKAEEGNCVVFTIRNPTSTSENGMPVICVSYDSFIEDVEVGDSIVVDGGMVAFVVESKAGPDVVARCTEPGLVLSRANLTFKRDGELIRGRNALLPVISAKDWMDIDFAISKGVDFLAVSFVKTADVMNNLRSYLQTRCPHKTIELVAKIESYDSIACVDDIIAASDAVMVARGDLGAQVPVEDVPSIQKYVVVKARQLGKPSMVASQLLQSMLEYPIPTRAEVADVADVVRQRADALMLSAESAAGRYPVKSLDVLRNVATRMEEWMREEAFGIPVLPEIGGTTDGRTSEEVCASAAMIANNLKAAAIFVYTRRGYMAQFLSRCRPDCPIFAFTDSQDVRQRLNLRWGVQPFKMDFSFSPEENIQHTFKLLKDRGLVAAGQLVVVVSDLRPQSDLDIVRSVQVRYVR